MTACAYKEIAAGTGAKLSCKGGLPDPACAANTPPPTFTYRLATGPGTGRCGEVRSGGPGGSLLKSLDCNGLNIGGGSSVVPEGPVPDGATNIFNASCAGNACSLSPASATETGSNNDCTETGCRFGAYLSIPNGPLSWCISNTFATPASGMLDRSSGEVSASAPLTSVVTYTGNHVQPCPPCSGAPGPGVCDASAANPGAACTGIDSSGSSYECAPSGSTLPGFGVDMTPLLATTFAVEASDPGGAFCPGQTSPGCFGETTCDFIRLDSVPGGSVAAGVPHSLTLASIFCIPQSGNILINGAAVLPGPGAVTLTAEGLLSEVLP
jgi:hypothetical protein